MKKDTKDVLFALIPVAIWIAWAMLWCVIATIAIMA